MSQLQQGTQSFQVGDIVRCVNPAGAMSLYDLRTDIDYTVSYVGPDIAGIGAIQLVEGRTNPLNGKPLTYMANRFALIERRSAPAEGTAVLALDIGARVVFSRDWKFYDEGDSGVIVDTDGDTVTVEFDGGNCAVDVPTYVLSVETGDFRVLIDGQMLAGSYLTENSAADAAETLGYKRFAVARLGVVSTYEVQDIPATTKRVREAA